jgi:hypothetical protein
VPGGGFDEGAHRGAAVLADDEIAFPVSRDRPVGRLGRTLADHDHVPEPAGLGGAVTARALDPSVAQAARQLPARFAAPLHEQRLVAGLVAHLHHRIVGELPPQPVQDLLRRPPLVHPLGHLAGQPGMAEPVGLGPTGPLPGTLMRPPGAVPMPAAVAG